MTDYICFTILIFCLALRIAPRIIWKNFNGTDAYFHLYYIELIKNNHHRIPKLEPRVLGGSNECTYPFFYHWLLSFFPERFIAFWDKFSGFIFDFLNGILLLFFLSLLRKINFSENCIILAAYIIAPGLTFSFIGPRPFSLTPRNFSQFIFFISCASLINSSSHHEIVNGFFFILSAIGFAILLLSSQFGTQVLFALLLASFFYLKVGAAIVLGVFLGAILFRGFLVSQIKAHIFHLEWYLKYNYSFVQHKTNFKKLVRFIREKNLRGVFYELVFYNQIFTSFFRHPTFFIALFLAFLPVSKSSLTIYQNQIIFILVPLFVAFVITNFGKARVFGEAERYVEFAYPLQIALFLSLISQEYFKYILFLMLAYNLTWYFYNLYQIKHQFASKYSYKNLFSHVAKDNVTLLCLSNNESYMFLGNTKARIVGFLVNISLRGTYKLFFDNFFRKYPLVDPGYIKEICEKYQVTHILRNKKIQEQESTQYESALEKLKLFGQIYEDECYTLYEKNNAY
jgi:hypothetical protein